MKTVRPLAVLTALIALGACSTIERSRSLADPATPAKTIAQQVCSTCHGVTGNSINPSFPNLAAQQANYLTAQLKEFRGHSRLDPAGFEYMWGLSRSLSDEQIKGLADYYAKQSLAAIDNTEDAALASEGKGIFEQGVTTANVPPCTACHGVKGQGTEQFPRVAGQHADYLVKQLNVFQRTDGRPEGVIMKTVAHGLTLKNIEAVAAYLQGVAEK